jgi:hypothetical protein
MEMLIVMVKVGVEIAIVAYIVSIFIHHRNGGR